MNKTILFFLILYLATSHYYLNEVGFPIGKIDTQNYLGSHNQQPYYKPLYEKTDLVHAFFIGILKIIDPIIHRYHIITYLIPLIPIIIIPYYISRIHDKRTATLMLLTTIIAPLTIIVGLYCQVISMLFYWITIDRIQKHKSYTIPFILSIAFHYYILAIYIINIVYLLPIKYRFRICLTGYMIFTLLTDFRYSIFQSGFYIYQSLTILIHPALIINYFTNKKDSFDQWGFLTLIGLFTLNSRVMYYAFPYLCHQFSLTMQSLTKQQKTVLYLIFLVWSLHIYSYHMTALYLESIEFGYYTEEITNALHIFKPIK